MKDVPVAFPDGLGLVTICEREDPRDAFVSNKYHSLDDLPAGSIVGTSSLRRQCQLAERRPPHYPFVARQRRHTSRQAGQRRL